MISVLDENCACVDTDFLIHVAETKCAAIDLLKYLAIAFEKLGLCGVMHPLIYEKELPQDMPIIQQVFEDQIIQVVDLDSLFSVEDGESKKAYYSLLVPELFKRLTGQNFPVEDIFNEWKRKCSFGEVHSIALCLVFGCRLFLSDDSDSKQLRKFIDSDLATFEVLTRKDFFNSRELGNEIPRPIRRQLSHARV